MSSQRKTETARANGAKSQGPATPRGRAISSRNSLRHGLSAKTIVLPTESQADFDLLLDSYIDQFRPRSGVELDLVHAMATARWRLRRLATIETNLFINESILCSEFDPERFAGMNADQHLAWSFYRLANQGPSLASLMRYEATLTRTYDRAFKQLQILQAIPEEPLGSFCTPLNHPPADPPQERPEAADREQSGVPNPEFPGFSPSQSPSSSPPRGLE